MSPVEARIKFGGIEAIDPQVATPGDAGLITFENSSGTFDHFIVFCDPDDKGGSVTKISTLVKPKTDTDEEMDAFMDSVNKTKKGKIVYTIAFRGEQRVPCDFYGAAGTIVARHLIPDLPEPRRVRTLRRRTP